MVEVSNPLAEFLRKARERKNLTLRSVEEASGVSNAYLSQVERGRIRQPSPVILHKLSKLYGVSYTAAMRLAGYPVPGSPRGVQEGSSETVLGRFSDVTPEEEQALAEYLAFLRTRRGSGSR